MRAKWPIRPARVLSQAAVTVLVLCSGSELILRINLEFQGIMKVYLIIKENPSERSYM